MADGTNRWRGLLASLLLALVSIAGVLAVGELIARHTWQEPAPNTWPERAPLDPDLPEINSVAELVTPNMRGRRRGVLHQTNSLGVRGPEYTRQPDPGVFRIAIAGDSVTMGSGVDVEQAYSAQLEELLNARSNGTHYEVVNLGISGLDIRHSVRRMKKIGSQYFPHLIVYGFTINDIEGKPYKRFVREVGLMEYRARYRRFDDSPSYLWRMIWPRLLTAVDLVRPPEGSYLHEVLFNYFENPDAWAWFESELQAFARLAQEHDVCAHVFLHTQLTRLGSLHPFQPVYDKVGKAAVELGLTVSSPGTVISGVDENRLRLSVWDPHPSPYGHRLFAEALRNALDDLPSECWNPKRGRRR